MKILKRSLLGFGVLILLGVAGMFATGNGNVLLTLWALTMGAPDLPFDESTAVAAADYADAKNWAALPYQQGRDDPF